MTPRPGREHEASERLSDSARDFQVSPAELTALDVVWAAERANGTSGSGPDPQRPGSCGKCVAHPPSPQHVAGSQIMEEGKGPTLPISLSHSIWGTFACSISWSTSLWGGARGCPFLNLHSLTRCLLTHPEPFAARGPADAPEAPPGCEGWEVRAPVPLQGVAAGRAAAPG